MRRHALQHCRRGRFEVHAVRERHQAGCRNNGVFRIGAPIHGIGDAVTGLDAGDFRAHGLDDTGSFVARGERQVCLIESDAEVNVDEIYSCRGDFDERVLGPGSGFRRIR